jgi:hypothetical protein
MRSQTAFCTPGAAIARCRLWLSPVLSREGIEVGLISGPNFESPC